MGTSCSKNKLQNDCQPIQEEIECKCLNGVVNKDSKCYKGDRSNEKCFRCYPTYGKPTDLDNNHKKPFNVSQFARLSSEEKKGYVKNGDKYFYAPNMPINGICKENEDHDYDKNLNNLGYDCNDFNEIELMSNYSELKSIIEQARIINEAEGTVRYTFDHVGPKKLFEILNEMFSDMENSNNINKIYDECKKRELSAQKETILSLLQKVSKDEAKSYENKKNTLAKNRRLVKFNVDNQTWYNNVFTLVKHLIYFGLLIYVLLLLKNKMLDTVFAILLILLITTTVIFISNDIIKIYKEQ